MKKLLFIISLATCTAAYGQDVSFLEYIRRESAMDFGLYLDWKVLHRTKAKKAYQPAVVKTISPGGDSLTLKGKVRVRGQHRLEICAFPPLKLKLDKSELARYRLSDRNEMDIVHHCQSGDLFEQYILRELLAYRLYELISPVHYKTQLIRLQYLHPDGSEAFPIAYAFLTEDKEEIVSRLDGRLYKAPMISKGAIDRTTLLQVALFQFMIGNTDWMVHNRHNLEFAGLPGHELLVTIPYDFDYAGLVNAVYAAHHESLKLSDISTRYYQGWCQTEEEVEAALTVFRQQKEKILALPYSIQGLNERSVRHAVSYLQNFYDIIENPHKLKSQVIRHCDLWPVKG